MDELFRLNVVRPPNLPVSRGVPMDYSSTQQIDLSNRLIPLIMRELAASVNAGVSGTLKNVARRTVGSFQDTFSTQSDILDEPLRQDLMIFAASAHAYADAQATAAEKNAISHDQVLLTIPDFAQLVSEPSFRALETAGTVALYPLFAKLVDSFLVQFILPNPIGPSLTTVAELIRPARLALRLLGDVTTLEAPATLAELEDAIAGPVILPEIIQLPKDRVHPVGVADLLVVKQHLLRYEVADVGRIENVLLGEKRSHSKKHTLTTERELTSEAERQTDTEKSLTTDDRSELKSEVQNTLKESLDVNGNVKVGYGGDNSATWHFSASLGVQYQRSSEESSKFATNIAKDVTSKASSKITERVKETRRTKTTEVLEDLEQNGFDNEKGTEHISGIYQFVNKVYLAQVFNYGKRLLFDVTIPEPAAYLLEVAREGARNSSLPAEPSPLKWVEFPPAAKLTNRPLSGLAEVDELTNNVPGVAFHDLSPEDLIADDAPGAPGVPYTAWVAAYGVPGIEQSPPRTRGAGKSFAREVQKESKAIVIEDQIQVPEGYFAIWAAVTAGWKHIENEDESALVTVRLADRDPFLAYDRADAFKTGDMQIADHLTEEGDIKSDNFTAPQKIIIFDTHDPLLDTVPVSISASNVQHVTIGIELHCSRLDSRLRKWQLETFTRIYQRHTDLMNSYMDAVNKANILQSRLGALGRNELANRETERIELKRASINILSGHGGQELLGKDAISEFVDAKDDLNKPLQVVPPVQEPDLRLSEEIGSLVRFFEEAFEWDKIGYVFYPYFWGRMDRWAERLRIANDDPMFEQFLKAGYARAVIPVRLGFERAFLYYLVWDEPWLGGDLPDFGEPLYLPITEEIRNQTGAPGSEEPVQDPWEITVPTELLKLRPDDTLPAWDWIDHVAELKNLRHGNWAWEPAP